MRRDDILRMADESGLDHMPGWLTLPAVLANLERFAALVAAATRESMRAGGWRSCAVGQRETQHCGLLETAVLAEREACARVCEELETISDAEFYGHEFAAAIRERGNDDPR